MTNLNRFWLSLLFLLLAGSLTLPVFAAEQQIYTIKKGDSLWGISQRFIEDPYYWPNLWANNPDITNPHLIYPGQKLRIYNGRIEFLPQYPEPVAPAEMIEEPAPVPVSVAEMAPEAPAPEDPQVQVMKSPGGGSGFLLTDETPLGLLVDSVDSRVLLTRDDLVFLDMIDPSQVRVGDSYSLFAAGKEVLHPQTGEKFGTIMFELGFLQVVSVNGRTVEARIVDAYREIERGAQVFPYVPAHKEIELKKGQGQLNGYLIEGQQDKLSLGQNDVVYIDLGIDSGLQVGNLLYISRPREASELALDKKNAIPLPDQLLGAALVVDARAKSSAAFIFKSVSEMHVGDQVAVAAE
jgi:LysM repeat protein